MEQNHFKEHTTNHNSKFILNLISNSDDLVRRRFGNYHLEISGKIKIFNIRDYRDKRLHKLDVNHRLTRS